MNLELLMGPGFAARQSQLTHKRPWLSQPCRRLERVRKPASGRLVQAGNPVRASSADWLAVQVSLQGLILLAQCAWTRTRRRSGALL
jgi:hypothetical protein